MSLWKRDLQLCDLDPCDELEITCRACGLTRYETVSAVAAVLKSPQLYLDQAEARLQCLARGCKGSVRIAIVHDGLNEGFVGGMA